MPFLVMSMGVVVLDVCITQLINFLAIKIFQGYISDNGGHIAFYNNYYAKQKDLEAFLMPQKSAEQIAQEEELAELLKQQGSYK